jgi:acyl-coenzyme A synthetase/AMP-(fatty) acid ligase
MSSRCQDIGSEQLRLKLLLHPILQAAAIGIPDEIKGEAIAIYATLKTNLSSDYITNCDIIKDGSICDRQFSFLT